MLEMIAPSPPMSHEISWPDDVRTQRSGLPLVISLASIAVNEPQPVPSCRRERNPVAPLPGYSHSTPARSLAMRSARASKSTSPLATRAVIPPQPLPILVRTEIPPRPLPG